MRLDVNIKRKMSGHLIKINNFLLHIVCLLVNGLRLTETKDVRGSMFPPGPFVLPMSSDGCPGELEDGWHTSYINITTTIPFEQAEKYLPFCGKIFEKTSLKEHPREKLRNSTSNLLRIFDKYTLTLNFCYKSRDVNQINSIWPLGNYSVYGTADGCPSVEYTKGFIPFNVTSCFPPLLRYNSDGYLPYYVVEEKLDSTAMTFLLCKRTIEEHNSEDQVTDTIQNQYPFFLVQDPKLKQCDDIEGFDVKEEVFPGLTYSKEPNFDEVFPLKYCYYFNKTSENDIFTYNLSAVWDNEGFNGLGTTHVHSEIVVPSVDISLLGLEEIVESWMMIDARETRIVSAILFQTYAFESVAVLHQDFNNSIRVARIYVGDERWSFLHGGALRCLFSVLDVSKKWNWFVFSDQELYSCWRSQYGRYVTMIFTSDKALVGHYEETCIVILTKDEEIKNVENCNEELGMENYDITDSQLTSSTFQANFPASQARPRLSGWCADFDDRRPFIQVDFQHILTVNGIVLINWYEVHKFLVNNKLTKILTFNGTYSFTLEFGTSLHDMEIHDIKPFVIDISQDIEIPQTYLLSEPVPAKHVRIYPTSFNNTSAPCIRFELLGCRKSEKQSLEKYGTRVDTDWSIYFDAPYIPINVPQEITSFGYPASYAHNQFYKWNITLSTEYAFLQFVDISLRKYEEPEFQNNMNCRDTIIVTTHDLINPLIYVKEYFSYASDHINAGTSQYSMRVLLTSDDNGRIIGIPQSRTESISLLLGFIACSEGQLLLKGRGFRAHIVTSDFLLCWSEETRNTFCSAQSMELISPNFIGMSDKGDRYRFVMQSNEHNVVMVKMIDFDISCKTDSTFHIIAEPKVTRYCNKDVVYEEQFYLIKLVRIVYSKIVDKDCELLVFPEGFRLMYEMLPNSIVTPNQILTDGEGFIQKQVCSDDVDKCYDMKFMFVEMSWIDAANLCRDNHMSLLTIHTAKEYNYIRELIIDIYSDNYVTIVRSTHGRIDTVNSFIGLRRYEDQRGVHHEHWIDGTKLTFNVWDENEPSETFLKLCTIIQMVPSTLEKENSFATVACEQKLSSTLMICEKKKRGSPKEEKQRVNIEECYETKARRYKGNLNVTHNGRKCQRWDSQFPNVHKFTNPAHFPDKTLSDASNFCRSPDKKNIPWCFTEDPLVPWEYCGINSCPKISDPHKDLVTMYQCSSGEWMSYTARCNGFLECFDGSDEENCTKDESDCKDDEFMCDDGRCIHVHQICDFKSDCMDASDEFCVFPACDFEHEFRCSSGQCISKEMRCDSFDDCEDGTDEKNCGNCNTDRAFQCGDRSCISKRLKCDSIVDCIDGADEASCEHRYLSCEDVLLDGLQEDGIYLIGEYDYRTRCTFNRTSGDVIMEFLNIDRANRGNNMFVLEVPDISIIEYVTEKGYVCTQQELFRSMASEYFSLTKFLNVNDKGPGETNFSLVVYTLHVKDHFNTVESRIHINNVRCSKKISEWNDNIHCSKGKFTDPSIRCIYILDENGIITGCRTLAHLQNCGNVPCPAHHFKCPESYCIPLMYVCNGRIDCPSGQDEQHCECEGTSVREISIIIESFDFLPYNRANLLYETATRLGGTLYSNHRNVKTVRVRLSADQKAESKYIFESSTVKSNSEHPSQIFERYYLNQTTDNFLGMTELDKVAIIWLSDDSTYSESELYTFNYIGMLNTSEKPLRYRIVLGQNAHEAGYDDDVIQLKIEDYRILGTLGGMLFPNICKGKPVYCNNKYRCSLSKVCIPHEQVCDGKQQCPYGDDEELCSFKCPHLCRCKPSIIICTNIHINNMTIDFPESTRILDASNTTSLGADILMKRDWKKISLLTTLNVSRCGIRELSKFSFQQFDNLLKLDISYNKFSELSRDTFVHLHLLKKLYMSGNSMLRVIESGTFNGLKVESLSINNADLESLDAYAFAGLTLKRLDLASNKIKSIADLTFSGLTCENINIQDNPVSFFTKRMFDGVTGVKRLLTSAYKFCCIRPTYLNEESCLPYKDEFSSCTHLMRNTTLQGLLWTIGLLALTGNVLSVVYRLIYDRKRMKLGYGIFVTNLAISDLLMGIYMLIIATADKLFMDRYIEVDESWRNSAWCRFAGVLSTISSEASVLFMCLITIDRLIIIKFPFGQYRFTMYSSMFAASIAWVFALLIAIVPVVYTDHFQNKFYSKSGVCLALPLTRDRPPGWLYATIVFIGFNLITFTLIATGQLLIYIEVRKHNMSKKRLNISRSNELKVAKNLLMLVTTDFMCWFPVGCMGVLALTGSIIPGEMYAWTAVLILPINSALNPFMYTFSAIISAKKITKTTTTNLTEDRGKPILDFLHYFTPKNILRSRAYSLKKALQMKMFSAYEIAYIIHGVVSYMDIVHENELVFNGQCSAENVVVRLNYDLKISGKATIIGIPSAPTKRFKKGGHTYDDIYDVGKLIDDLLRNVHV